MQESILFKNVTIATSKEIKTGDVYVSKGKIKEIAPSINKAAELVINEKGLTLMPGVIDPHVHFRDPGVTHKEDLYSGSKAAVSGGVTSFFDMPNTKPSCITREHIAEKKIIASEKSLANYNFFIGATAENLEELNDVENIAGIKIFVGSSTGNLLVDKNQDLEKIFKNGSRLIAVHSEEEDIVRANMERYKNSTNVKDHYLKIRTSEAAIKCTKRLVDISKKYKRRLHICHLTTKEEAEFLATVNEDYITTEVSPQHLLLFGPEIYDEIGTYAQINPPIRGEEHREALWKALLNKTISCIATDHAPHLKSEKDQPFGKAPSGMPGVETSLPLMLSVYNQGICSLNDIVRWMCEAPASLYGIQNKGFIKEGFDADLTLVNLDGKKTLSHSNTISRAGWTAFEGWEVTGVPVATFVNGNLVYREGDFFEDVKGKEVIIK